MSFGILDRINYGYGHLEPVILSAMALRKKVLLLGRHGTGKSRLTRILAKGHGDGGFVIYNAPADDLINIAGIPDADGLKAGEFRFVPHARSVWDKHTIVIDEITRATHENQNLWLEMTQERSLFGIELRYQSLIATANPESYAAAIGLDEALLDRFHVVIPVPELQEIDRDQMDEILARSGDGTTEPSADELTAAYREIGEAREDLVSGGATARIDAYLRDIVPELLRTLSRGEAVYVSPRTYARLLPEMILAIGAYHAALGTSDPLEQAAEQALVYSVGTKVGIKPAVMHELHSSFKGLLGARGLDPDSELALELSQVTDFEELTELVQERWDRLRPSLGLDGVEKILGRLVSEATSPGQRQRLPRLERLFANVGYHGEAMRQVEGQLALALRRSTRYLLRHPDVEPEVREALAEVARDGALSGRDRPEALELKRLLIEAWEEKRHPAGVELLSLLQNVRGDGRR